MKRCNNCFELYDDSRKACPYCGYVEGSAPSEMFPLFPGVELAGRYIIGEMLGYGGFGITYKTWDKKLETVVVIKEYYPGGIVNRTPGNNEVVIYAKKRSGEFTFGKERFLEEAKNMAKFNSEKNIINVIEYFEENNTAYIVMEYLDGISLKQYLKQSGGKLDLESALEVVTSIAKALEIVHKEGIIHRDVSLDNIFLCSNGPIKLIDFGAARFARDEDRLMTIIVKPGFAPPEQYEKINKQGPWTDIYALGATFYNMITGVKPEESTNRKINDTLSYPQEIDPSIPECIGNAIMKAMALDVDMRFKSVEEFMSTINDQKTVLPVDVEKKRKKRYRNLWITVAALVILSGVLASSLKLTGEIRDEKLSDCTIEMWYCASGDSDQDMAEEDAYKAVIERFTTAYPNVKINLTKYGVDEYKEKLPEEQGPNIYEWCGEDASTQMLSLKSVYGSKEAQSCSMLKYAPDYYDGYDRLPLGYDVPIVFSKHKDDVENEKKIDSLAQFSLSGNNENSFVNDYKDLTKMFSNADQYYRENAFNEFVEGEADHYGSLTDNYTEVRKAIPGQYYVSCYDTEKIHCRYSSVWAASDKSKNENRAVLKLMRFMLESSAQDILHIQNKSTHIPINDETLEVFVLVDNDFSEFFDNREKYIIEK